MNLTQFVNTYNNTTVGTGSCVALIRKYEEDVLGLVSQAVGNAYDYYSNFYNEPFLYNNFDRYTNDGVITPQIGDMVVWDTNQGGRYGHIAIAHSNISSSGFTSFDQNWTPNISCLESHTYTNVAGWLRPKTSWVSVDRYLTQSEMENNANIIINYYRSQGINDNTIAAILGNMQAESTLSPVLTERGGGGGYGLVQWTPQSDLINACNVLGLSPYSSGDVQIQVVIAEILGNPASIKQWYTSQAFIQNYYNSGASADMIGITGQEFLDNSMNWTADKLAVLFMAGYERPSYDPSINHYSARQQYALNWLTYMGGIIPPTPPTPTGASKKTHYKFVLFNRRRRVRNNG